MSEITPAGAANAPAVSFAQQPSEPTQAQPHANSIPESEPDSIRNPAVRRCVEARTHRIRLELRKGVEDYEAEESGNDAYRQAMPDLSGLQNIQDFIACVAHGMMLDSSVFSNAPRLLYAAQVAMSAARRDAKSAPKPS